MANELKKKLDHALRTDARAVLKTRIGALHTRDLLPGDALTPATRKTQTWYSHINIALSADGESAQLLSSASAARSATSGGLSWWDARHRRPSHDRVARPGRPGHAA